MTARPLYGELAWAYDLVVPAPAGPPPERVAALLHEHGVRPAAALVDAGCGTGRYATALAALGFAVTGVDASGAARPGAGAATARRYGAGPVRTERVVEAGGRRLRFTAETTLDPERRAMRVRERYAAVAGGAAVERAGVFEMRCFTPGELRALPAGAGFPRAGVRAGAEAGAAPDRLVLVCVR